MFLFSRNHRVAAPILMIASALVLEGCPPPHGNPGYVEYSRVSAGFGHTCALAKSGSVYCWGYNTTGQLGNNGTGNSGRPVLVGGGHSFTSVSAGGSQTCGVSQGDVLCWGSNSYGQLGISPVGGTQMLPVKSNTPAGVSFASVNAGSDFTCALTTTGAAYCWGHTLAGVIGDNGPVGNAGAATNPGESQPVPTPVAGNHVFRALAIGGGGRHVCGYTGSGQAYCWGDNLFNEISSNAGPTQCPIGTSSWSCYKTPEMIQNFDATGVAAGGDFSCVTRSSYELWCRGTSAAGQLGSGTAPCTFANGLAAQCAMNPVQIAKVNAMGYVEVTAYDDAMCASVYPVGNSVMCWGSNSHGQLGDGTTAPHPTPAPTNPKLGALDLSMGFQHTCVVTDGYLTPANLVYCWGSNVSGQVGTGTIGGDELSPKRIVEP